MSDAPNPLEPPEPGPRDRAIAGARGLVKGLAGAVPLGGGLLAEAVDLLYRQPIEKRRDEWARDIADALREVQERQADLTPDRLAENEEFVTILHRATQVAVATHEKEKRRALRNAIVHSALGSPPSQDLQFFFLRLVEELTVNQILVLALYNDPHRWFQKSGRRPPVMLPRFSVLEAAYPELAASPYVRELTLADLERRGLLGGVSGVSGHAIGGSPGQSPMEPITSSLARQFLSYITSEGEA